MSDMWMPPQTTRPPFFTARRAAGTSAPTGAKMTAASSNSGGISSEPPAQTAPSERANVCDACVARARKGVDAAALPDRDLRQNVCGGAKAVEAESFGCTGHAVTTPADKSGAKQRRRFCRIEVFIEWKTKARIRHHMARVAAVARIAGEQRPVAQILPVGPAIGTNAAGRAQPRNADALADREAGDSRSHRRNAPDDFVARYDRQFRLRQFAVYYMQIGAADPAGHNLNKNFARPRRQVLPLPHHQRASWTIEHHCTHQRHEQTVTRIAGRRNPPVCGAFICAHKASTSSRSCAPKNTAPSCSRITARPTG